MTTAKKAQATGWSREDRRTMETRICPAVDISTEWIACRIRSASSLVSNFTMIPMILLPRRIPHLLRILRIRPKSRLPHRSPIRPS